MDIYWGSGSGPAWRVLLALEIKKLPYTSHVLAFDKREHKSAEMLAMNPRGKVPVLKEGDFALYESLAILEYLDEKYPDPPLYGKTPAERALTRRLVMEAESYLAATLRTVTRPLLFNQLADKETEVKEAIPAMHEELSRWEQQLAGKPYFTGDRVSAADIVVLPLMMTLARAASKPAAAPLDLGVKPLEARYPKLAAWVARMEAIPGYDKTFPPHWRNS